MKINKIILIVIGLFLLLVSLGCIFSKKKIQD